MALHVAGIIPGLWNKIMKRSNRVSAQRAQVQGGRWEVEEGGDICIYLWLIHVDVWQKPTQYCKAIILQLKIKKKELSTSEYLLEENKGYCKTARTAADAVKGVRIWSPPIITRGTKDECWDHCLYLIQLPTPLCHSWLKNDPDSWKAITECE